MSTYMAKSNEIEKKWYIIDAAGKPLGRVAAKAAAILRGKHRPEFTPNVDCGEYVIIINYTSDGELKTVAVAVNKDKKYEADKIVNYINKHMSGGSDTVL